MSTMKQKIAFAKSRDVHVYNHSKWLKKTKDVTITSTRFGYGDWAVYRGIGSPHTGFTKRQAVNLAYAVAMNGTEKSIRSIEGSV